MCKIIDLQTAKIKLDRTTTSSSVKPPMTVEQFKEVRFNVIDHFGGYKSKRNRKFFIWNIVEPKAYGYDRESVMLHEIMLKTDEDCQQLQEYLQDLFQVEIEPMTMKNCIAVIKQLRKSMKATAPVKDWGTGHITYFPYAERYGVANG